ncbi:MAG: galactose mutarotase [Planctomycetes bacterium]|nr:galactose mutarotase [Planctomycetota bacterium]
MRNEPVCPQHGPHHASVDRDLFGVTKDGVPVERYTLHNARGMTVRIITYGATVTELLAADRHGQLADVVLGFDNLHQYETVNPYFGSTIGRVAFRTTNAEFTLDGRTYRLTRNAGPHHLHGGTRGLSHVVWQAEPLFNTDSPAVRFRCHSPDGDQGYPGNLDASVVFTLSDTCALHIDYLATTDQATPVNLTHHSYFNLAGAAAGDVLGHLLQLAADRHTPTDAALIPTGEIATVRNTPFDFQEKTEIGARIEAAGGYDLSYLRSADSDLVATLEDPVSGRRMEVTSTSPAIVLYTGNYLDGTLHGKESAVYRKHAAVCLETGHLPDSVHQPAFPSIIVRPGDTYRERCTYRFSVA